MPFTHLGGVVDEMSELARRFEAAGHRLYLVGGIVRDQWLDRPLDASSDIDLTTDATPDETKRLVTDLASALWTQGERFGTIGLHHRDRAIEITTHRAEAYDPESRKPEVTFGTEIAVDLSRRDFTVNAMAIRVPSGELVDPWGGAGDLAAHRLRTPLDPETSFADDPLRMLRAARFGAKYRLVPAPELVTAATMLRERLRIVAIERIGDELRRLFGLDDPAPGLEFLVATGLAEVLLTWGDTAPMLDEVRASLPDAADVASRVAGPWSARLAAFLLTALDDVDEVETATARLRLSRDDARAISRAAGAATEVLDLVASGMPAIPAPALRRWRARAGDRSLAFAIAEAVDPSAVQFRRAFDELIEREPHERPDLLDGGAVIDLLGVEPGPIVGEAVEVLRQALFDQGPLPAAAQKELLTAWWTDRGPDT